jgi:hypothetical protein
MAVRVESVVEKIAMKQISFEFFAFSLPIIIPPILDFLSSNPGIVHLKNKNKVP